MGKALPTATTAIAYYRVSTQKQGQSGLGLDAQRDIVATYCGANHLRIVAEFTEIESGRRRDRVQLAAALAESKRTCSRLVIAKLDRLARDAAFTMSLRDAGVDFVACDLPDANTLTIGIFASFAQFEAERISTRTKDALRQAKARGVKLGAPEHLTPAAMAAGRAAQRDAAIEANSRLANYIEMLRNAGNTYREIADRLNQDGYTTRMGKPFKPMTVQRMVKRLE